MLIKSLGKEKICSKISKNFSLSPFFEINNKFLYILSMLLFVFILLLLNVFDFSLLCFFTKKSILLLLLIFITSTVLLKLLELYLVDDCLIVPKVEDFIW